MTHHGNEEEHAGASADGTPAHPTPDDMTTRQDDVTAREQMGADVETALANGMRPVSEEQSLRGDSRDGAPGVPEELGIAENEELRTGDASMNADRG